MLFFERWRDRKIAFKTALDTFQAHLWTMLPVRVTDASSLTKDGTVQVNSNIKGRNRVNVNGQLIWQDVSMPTMPVVPVKFPSGGGWTMTFPIANDDEGTAHFASRCIDNWWAQGGEQPPITQNGVGSLRKHNLSDGFYIPGGRSKPKALQNLSTSDPQLRTDDGTFIMGFSKTSGFYIRMPNGVSLTLDTSGNLAISGPQANVTAQGDITAGQGGSDQITLQHHLHVNAGGAGDSGQPKPGT